MDLTSGSPFWRLKDGCITHYSPLDRNLNCDVAVIGAGISGALVAYYLVKEGVNAVVLDKRLVGTGSTCATTGLLQYEVDTPLFKLIDFVGRKRAIRSYHLGLDAIGKIERLTQEIGDACGFKRTKSLYLATDESAVKDLQTEYKLRRELGIRIDLLQPEEIKSFFGINSYPAGLLSYDAGQIDAYRLTQVLLASARSKGLQVYDRTEVCDYRNVGSGVEIITATAHRISASRLVFAMGYEIPAPLQKDIVKLKSTYALVTMPNHTLPAELTDLLVWETARPYFYMRSVDDNRIMMGGEDEDFDDATSRDRHLSMQAQKLERRFRTMFPSVPVSVASRWAGTFGETKDGLAYIGENIRFPKAYFALGYGGNGITYSLIAAEIIRDLHMGRQNTDAEIFSFDR